MEFFKTFKEIDFFGKEPEFYIEGKSKQITFIGRIFTLIFIIIYILILSYKLYRMSKRIDITYYDTYSFTDEAFTNENFFLVFSVTDKIGEPYINESIYYPVAHYYHVEDEERKNEEMKIERCNVNKKGSKYNNFFSDSQLNNYYCLSNINHTMEPYLNSFLIEICPCKNTSENNNHCQSKEIIDRYLNGKIFVVYFPNVILTPFNYSTPVKESILSEDSYIFKNVGQYLYNEMQLVRIETITNIFGFDFFSKPRTEEYIKFDNIEYIPNPGYNLDDETNNNCICMYEFVLGDKILLETRQYIQLIEVLGDVEGFMEIVRSFISVICTLFVDKLYEENITNNLFSFNIKKRIILLKGRKIIINKDKINFSENILSNKTQQLVIKNNDEYIDDKKSENIFISKKHILKTNSFINENKNDNNNSFSLRANLKEKNRTTFMKYNYNKITKIKTKNDYKEIIDKINLKDILFSSCSKKKKNLYKILLNESMNIIIDKLDILNIFRNINLIKHINSNNYPDLSKIKMSEECSQNLSDIL